MAKFKFLTDLFDFFFPQYYRDNDTYKDASGKGILERFIEVCSEYFDEDITPDIDNFMDILDVDKTTPIFLNYIWEFLGEIPYAYGVLIRGTPFTEEDLQQWIEEDRPYPTVDPRDILRYAISLYKIRCTEKFYEVLGRLYNVTFEIEEIKSTRPPGGLTNANSWEIVYDAARYDNESYRYDVSADCMDCTDLVVTITVTQDDYAKWDAEGNWEKVKQALVNILNKYIPINVNQLSVDSVTFNIG